MAAYPRLDPYKRSRYDRGIDAKIVVMGNTGVGKTSLLHRYTHGKFDPRNTTSTTGAFFVTKKVDVNGVKVRLQLWDTAGQERFRSMAPMYYRGANAALLLYDITNIESFQDVRGWLEELKKNCSSDLIIYIVGAKADLIRQRQVTSDFARASIQKWFPPSRPPTPPPPPPPPPSTFSYIRPRFTSFTSTRSAPLRPRSPAGPSYIDAPVGPRPSASALKRSHTNSAVTGLPRSRTTSNVGLARANSAMAAVRYEHSPPAVTSGGGRFGSHFGSKLGGWSQLVDIPNGSDSLNEDDGDDDDYDEDEEEWGLRKGMELFEVSSKDDSGIPQLFDSLIGAIIQRKDSIEAENELKRRDSVFLSSDTPSWAKQAEEIEAQEKERAAAAANASWNSSCCQI